MGYFQHNISSRSKNYLSLVAALFQMMHYFLLEILPEHFWPTRTPHNFAQTYWIDVLHSNTNVLRNYLHILSATSLLFQLVTNKSLLHMCTPTLGVRFVCACVSASRGARLPNTKYHTLLVV